MAIEFDDLRLVARAAQADRDALEQLLFAHYSRLAAVIETRIPPNQRTVISVEDVLQETFVHAFRDIARFDNRGPGAFNAWLDAVAVNRLQDLLKGLRRKKRGGDYQRAQRPRDAARSSIAQLVDTLSDRNAATPSQNVAGQEATHAVQVGMAGLPDDQRNALRLRYIDHKSLEEAAEAMDRTPGAVRGLVHRAKQSLREMLGRSTRWFYRK